MLPISLTPSFCSGEHKPLHPGCCCRALSRALPRALPSRRRLALNPTRAVRPWVCARARCARARDGGHARARCARARMISPDISEAFCAHCGQHPLCPSPCPTRLPSRCARARCPAAAASAVRIVGLFDGTRGGARHLSLVSLALLPEAASRSAVPVLPRAHAPHAHSLNKTGGGVGWGGRSRGVGSLYVFPGHTGSNEGMLPSIHHRILVMTRFAPISLPSEHADERAESSPGLPRALREKSVLARNRRKLHENDTA